MSKAFDELRERLLRGGVAPRHVRRYLGELGDHLADLTAEEERAGRGRAEAESAALIRLGRVDDLAQAMIEQRQLHSWSVRAPWAVFGLAPIFSLAGAYLAACLILWSGWRMFLPETTTPFVPIGGFAGYYFGVGRLLYYVAPILIGSGVGVVAARQRLKAVWPMVGGVLVALMGATAQVHASRAAGIGGVRHIGMGFALGSSVQGVADGLLRAAVILSVMMMPYVIWRLQRARPAAPGAVLP